MRKFNLTSKQFILFLFLQFIVSNDYVNCEKNFFSNLSKRSILTKPSNLVKGFFKSFTTFGDSPPPTTLTQEDLLMQQAFNSPPKLLSLESQQNPISEYLVANFDRLNVLKNNKQQNSNQILSPKDHMTGSESIVKSNYYHPNNLMTNNYINHNLNFDDLQKLSYQQDQPSEEISYEKKDSSPSLSIGSAPGGGIGLKMGKFQMTFKKGADGPQINLGTNEETNPSPVQKSFISMSRGGDKKKGMNVRLGKALSFSIGGENEDDEKLNTMSNIESKTILPAKNINRNQNFNNFKPNGFNKFVKQNSNLMPSASENNYDESPGISLPAISIGGNGDGKPAITIGGSDNDDENASVGYNARPQITIGGGGSSYTSGSGSEYSNNGDESGRNNAHESGWGEPQRPRIRLRMPDFPQTYIEKNFKLPPIKLKINAQPRVKITTGTKDPLEKKPIEEDPDMEDIFRPPEPFNVTVPDKNKTETNEKNDFLNNQNMNMNNNFDKNNGNPNNQAFNPNFSNSFPNNQPNFNQYIPYQQNNFNQPQNNQYNQEQINFVSKNNENYEKSSRFEQNSKNYYSYNSNHNHQNYQFSKHMYENVPGETKSIKRNYKGEFMKNSPSNNLPVYKDYGSKNQNNFQNANYNRYSLIDNNKPSHENFRGKNFYDNNANQLNYQRPLENKNINNYNPNFNYNRFPENQKNYNTNMNENTNFNRMPMNRPAYNENVGQSQHNSFRPQLKHLPIENVNSNNHQKNLQNNLRNQNENNFSVTEKSKAQIEEENSIYIKSKDEYAEDRPQIILDVRPKISISHVNSTHPEEKKDPRHKNPFIKMLLNPEFVNHTTASPELDDDFSVTGYNKNYLNHYDYNKYKNHKPGKYGLNYVKRTTTSKPIVNKNRKSLTTTDSTSNDAEDSDYEDTTPTPTTTTTLPSSSKSDENEDDEASTKSSMTTIKDNEDSKETTTISSMNKDENDEKSTTAKTSNSSDEDSEEDEFDKLKNKLTTTLGPGQTLPTDTTTMSTTTEKKTTKISNKDESLTTMSSADDDDYDFGFQGRKKNRSKNKPKPEKKKKISTTSTPKNIFTDDENDETTMASKLDDNKEEKSSDETETTKSSKEIDEDSSKDSSKKDFFSQMMKTLRSEKEDSKTTPTTMTTTVSSTESMEEDEEEVTLSTTTAKTAKIKARNQTSKQEALQFTTTDRNSVASAARGSSNKIPKKKDTNHGINNYNYDKEVTTNSDKTMLINLLRMVNDNMEDMKRWRLSSTPCPDVQPIKTTTNNPINNKDEDENDDNNSDKNNDSKILENLNSTNETETESLTLDDIQENNNNNSTSNNNSTFNENTENKTSENEDESETTEISNLTSSTPKIDEDNFSTMTSSEETTVIKKEGKKIGFKKKKILKKSKKTKNKDNSSSSFSFSNFENEFSISSTESSFSFNFNSGNQNANEFVKNIEKGKDDIFESVGTESNSTTDSSLKQKEEANSETNDYILNNEESKNNEPIIVVLLPNEDKLINT